MACYCLPFWRGYRGTPGQDWLADEILLHQGWLTERLAAIEDPEHHRLLRRFATWRQMRRMRAAVEKGPLGRSRAHQGKQETSRAGVFLALLADRGGTVEPCRQACLDVWHAEEPATCRCTGEWAQ